MKIAIIGYGSLIWDLETLAPMVTGDWQLGGGPPLPVEFSRISPKRQKALVLVVDETLEHDCATSTITSTRTSLDDAVNDLAARERCLPEMIAVQHRSHPTTGRASHSVAKWLASTTYDAAIWTGLEGNFNQIVGVPFTHDAALDYLTTLRGDALSECWRYISFAPPVTDTPFRRFVTASDFWRTLVHDRVRLNQSNP